MQSLVCEKQLSQVRDILEPFNDAGRSTEVFDLSFEELSFQERSNDGSVAVVQVTGILLVSFLGQQEKQAVDEEHVLVREGKRWVICDP